MAYTRCGIALPKTHTATKIDVAKTPLASFESNVSGLYLPEILAYIQATQAGSGDPSPDNVRPITGWSGVNVTRTGKNLIKNVRSSGTLVGLNYTVNSDGSIFIAGGQTATSLFLLSVVSTNNTAYMPLTDFGLKYDTDLILSGCPSGGDNSTYRLIMRSGGSASNRIDTGSGVSFNIASTSSTLIWNIVITVASGYTTPTDGLLFKPQVELGSSATTYEPYNGNTYTIQFGGTYYGGYLNVTTGLLTVTYAHKDLGDINWTAFNPTNKFIYTQNTLTPAAKPTANNNVAANMLCEIYPTLSRAGIKYSAPFETGIAIDQTGNIIISDQNNTWSDINAAKAELTGHYVVYELATPQTVQLTPAQIEQLLGQNNVFCSSGDVAVKYWKID